MLLFHAIRPDNFHIKLVQDHILGIRRYFEEEEEVNSNKAAAVAHAGKDINSRKTYHSSKNACALN